VAEIALNDAAAAAAEKHNVTKRALDQSAPGSILPIPIRHRYPIYVIHASES
jgi:hypothetical protein